MKVIEAKDHPGPNAALAEAMKESPCLLKIGNSSFVFHKREQLRLFGLGVLFATDEAWKKKEAHP